MMPRPGKTVNHVNSLIVGAAVAQIDRLMAPPAVAIDQDFAGKGFNRQREGGWTTRMAQA